MTFHFEATGIGSVPHTDQKRACEVIFERFQHIPFWPQLSRKSFLENMYVQFSEGMPGLIVDEKARTVRVDSLKAIEGIEEFYEKYLEDDLDFFSISPSHAAGFYEFLKGAASHGKALRCLKGHVTGPVSFALSVTDEHKRALMYHEELFEALTRLLSMKARWQIRKMKEFSDKVIIFIDEPYLVSIGSSFVTIDAERAMRNIDEVAGAIRKEGALAGIHCCGNTDWQALLGRNIDILSFDAYNFMEPFLLFAEDARRFIAGGGTIAWGIVPTAGVDAKAEDAEGLFGMLMKGLAALGTGKGAASSLVTPSCGTGTLSEVSAEAAFALARDVSGLARESAR